MRAQCVAGTTAVAGILLPATVDVLQFAQDFENRELILVKGSQWEDPAVFMFVNKMFSQPLIQLTKIFRAPNIFDSMDSVQQQIRERTHLAEGAAYVKAWRREITWSVKELQAEVRGRWGAGGRGGVRGHVPVLLRATCLTLRFSTQFVRHQVHSSGLSKALLCLYFLLPSFLFLSSLVREGPLQQERWHGLPLQWLTF